jgi:hypothetical protein
MIQFGPSTAEKLKYHSTEESKAREALQMLRDKEMRDRINHRVTVMNNVERIGEKFHSRTGHERAKLSLLIAQHGGIIAALQRKARKA